MRKFGVLASCFIFSIAALFGFLRGNPAFAEDDVPGTSISISPVSKILQLAPSMVYDDVLKVSNNGSSPMHFEVYAAPYSYSYSEAENTYKLGFNNENSYTQITRWISFTDKNGELATRADFVAEPGTTVEVNYHISTPASMPAGGQYAVIFAHTLSSDNGGGGIKTEASPGLVIYGRASGDTIISGETSELEVHQSMAETGKNANKIGGTAKVKNVGNVDFMASGKLKVTGIFGQTYYETPVDSTRSRSSIIPEAELIVSDTWDDTPYFGLFNVEWTVIAASETTTITAQILILPAPIIIVIILLLTIITIWIIILIRKRRERRARFMV